MKKLIKNLKQNYNNIITEIILSVSDKGPFQLNGYILKKEFFSNKNEDFLIVLKEIKNGIYFSINGKADFSLYSYKLKEIVSVKQTENVLKDILNFYFDRDVQINVLYKVFKDLNKFFYFQCIMTADKNEKHEEFITKCPNFETFLKNAHKLSFFDKILKLIKAEYEL